METKDTQIEGLEEKLIYWRYTPPFAAEVAELLKRQELIDLIPAVKALQDENERLSGLSKEHFNKLNEWQAAYIKAERTLLLAGFADEGGELWKPPLGPSPSPLLDRIATLEAQLADERLFIKGLQAQLAGGEAVAWQVRFYHTDNGDPGWSSWQDCTKQEFILYGGYTAPKCEVRALYTAAPAISRD